MIELKSALCATAAFAMTACASTGAPHRASLSDTVGPAIYAAPAPVVEPASYQTASLWTNSPQSLFGDRRAQGPGDILTVQIDIDDRADMRASVATDRDASENFSIGSLFGLTEFIDNVLPGDNSLTPAVDLERNSQVDGSGQLRRQETLSLTLAAQVAEVTPNGDLVIVGRQNVQVEGEARRLYVSGVVRREDISRRNVITLDKIANARVGYDGQGSVSRTTNDRIGTRALDAVVPF